MIMIGLEFTGDIPFEDVYVHPIIQAPDGRRMSKSLGTGIDPLDLIEGGPRPPVFEQGGDFPAYGADAVRFGLLAMSSTQDVRFNEDKSRRGASSPTSSGTRRGCCSCACPTSCPSRAPVTVEDALDPLAAAAREGVDGAGVRGLRAPPRGARALRLRLRRPLRLVPRADQAAALRRRQRRGQPRSRCTCCGRRSRSPIRSSRSSPRRSGPTCPASAGLLMACAVAGGRRVAARRGRRGRARTRDRRRAGAARAGATASARRRARALEARLEADGYERTAEAVARLARVEWTENGTAAGRRRRRPRRHVAVLASDAVDTEAEAKRAAAERARLEAEIKRARGQARQPGLRRQGARRRSSRPSARSSRACSRSWRRSGEPGRSSRPRTTSSRSSCSG